MTQRFAHQSVIVTGQVPALAWPRPVGLHKKGPRSWSQTSVHAGRKQP